MKRANVMNFEEFQKKRVEMVEWMTVNGFNEGDCEKNGEYKVIELLVNYYDLFIDIGANNGIFIDRINAIYEESLTENSSPFILAFEPNPELKNVIENKIKKGKLVDYALSNQKGEATFNIYPTDNTTSSLFSRSDMMPHFTTNVVKINVNLDTLDSHLPVIKKESSKGIFIKIDAEGVELLVIEGAQEVLKSMPLVFVMFEYSKAWKNGNLQLKDAFHLLDNCDYQFYRVTPLGLEHLRFYSPEMEGSEYCNYFAVKGFNLGDIFTAKLVDSPTHRANNFFIF
jgi:FkbM family methyltransferase